VSLKEAFTSRRYKFASINAQILAFFQQFTGISVIILFSTQIFQDMKN